MNESESGNAGPKKSRRRLFRLVILIVLITGGALGIPWYLDRASHESTDDAFINGHIIQVSPRVPGHVIRVHVSDNQKVKKGDLLAELDPAEFEIRLDSARAAFESSKVSDQMRNLDVDLSTIASQSRLDDAAATLDAARARVEASKAQAGAAAGLCREIKVQVELARTGLELARSEAEAAKAEHHRNQTDLDRYRQMAQKDMVSRQQVDHMAASAQMSAARLEAARQKIRTKETTIRQAEAALSTATENLLQAKAQVKASEAQLVQAKAGLLAAQAGPGQVDQSRSMTRIAKTDLEKAKSALDQAELNLSYTRIYAGTDGFVSNKSVEPGNFVQVGQPLMALVSPDVWVTANFKETQLTRMKPGQPVRIEVDTYPGVVFKGRVDSIQHGTGSRFSLLPAQNATGNFVKVVQRIPVKIVFDPDTGTNGYTLVPGMSVIPEVAVSDNSKSTAKSGTDPDKVTQTR